MKVPAHIHAGGDRIGDGAQVGVGVLDTAIVVDEASGIRFIIDRRTVLGDVDRRQCITVALRE